MLISYLRRYRMEIDLANARLVRPVLPEDYFWVPWQDGLEERHAATKYASFCREIDSRVFPALGEARGCRQLMRAIAEHDAFLPAATWLIAFRGSDEFALKPRDCATIQGVLKPHHMGSIQNVGVAPAHRGIGLGRALLLQALFGFRRAGRQRVYLEVTAENRPAVALYESLGFRISRTMFHVVETEWEPCENARPMGRRRRVRKLAAARLL